MLLSQKIKMCDLFWVWLTKNNTIYLLIILEIWKIMVLKEKLRCLIGVNMWIYFPTTSHMMALFGLAVDTKFISFDVGVIVKLFRNLTGQKAI